VKRFGALLLGAVVVGSLDSAYAILFWASRGATPTRIFQSVAAGLLGRDSYQGGLRTALLGVALHYGISFAIVLVYWIVSRFWRTLVEKPYLFGPIYGLSVYGVMNYVVIPLSATRRPAFNASWVFWSLVVHALLVGLPAALFARHADSAR
jgi:hypothetical protein